jgi:threonine synthase
MHLRCSVNDCGTTLDLHDRVLACPKCGNLLEVVIDPPKVGPAELKRQWLNRRMSYDVRDTSGVWRFREMLPDVYGADGVVTLSEGNVPLVPALKTKWFAGLSDLSFKHLGWNPTGSFKDLGMTAGITEAKFVGAKAVACASTGNTAASLAAYAARAGVEGRVYLPAGEISANKLAQALDYGATMTQISGNFDDALNTLLDSKDPDLYFLNSINPFRIEGQKTAMIEMLEQFGWRIPDYVVVPGGNLGNSSAFGKAFMELKAFGMIERAPRIVIVQAAGSNPLARMWASGASELEAVTDPQTVATAIKIGNPRSWKKSLQGVRFSGGFVLDVTDEEIGEAKDCIGRDGIGCEPASATTLAGLRKLTRSGKIDRDAKVVAILTGHVLKDTDYIIKRRQAKHGAAHNK